MLNQQTIVTYFKNNTNNESNSNKVENAIAEDTNAIAEDTNAIAEDTNAIAEDTNATTINLTLEELSNCMYNIECNNNVVNLEKNICLVDLSYMTFTRFFAIRRWYETKMKTDKPKWVIPNDYNWMEDILFMNKFDKLFFEKLLKLCKARDIPQCNIIFAVDCKHKDNWRVLCKDNYKGTRKDSHERNKFHNFNIFPYVRNKLIKDLQMESRNIVLQMSNLEADDIIALLVNYFTKSKKINSSITIMANDKDYVQLCNANIDCCDLSGNSLSKRILKNHNNAKEYLIYKILTGDISDNIMPCYFTNFYLSQSGIKTKKDYVKASNSVITKLFNKKDCYNLLCDYLEYVRDLQSLDNDDIKDKWYDKLDTFNVLIKDNQFVNNAKLIDFKNIPIMYVKQLYGILESIF